jgi:hypothetical protein
LRTKLVSQLFGKRCQQRSVERLVAQLVVLALGVGIGDRVVAPSDS